MSLLEVFEAVIRTAAMNSMQSMTPWNFDAIEADSRPMQSSFWHFASMLLRYQLDRTTPGKRIASNDFVLPCCASSLSAIGGCVGRQTLPFKRAQTSQYPHPDLTLTSSKNQALLHSGTLTQNLLREIETEEEDATQYTDKSIDGRLL